MKNLFVCFITIFLLYTTCGAQESNIKIKNAWARPAAAGTNSALYFIIENNGADSDTLISVQSKAADIVEIHESYERNNSVMGMRAVDFVALPPKSKTEFNPGGLHIMFIDVQKDLRIGASFEASLHFKHAGIIKIKPGVLDAPSAHMKH